MLSTILYAAGCAGGHGGGATPEDSAHVAAMAHEHAGDSPVANAATAQPRQEVRGEEVVYATVGGKQIRGYMAYPAAAGANAALPAILMVHEWWGLNENMRMMARRLAGEGYRTLAVDMYGGQVATDAQAAQRYMMEVMNDRESGAANLAGAAAFLKQQQHAPKIGTIGWCFGGGWSLQAGLRMPEQVDAVVMYYGQPVTDRAQLARLDAPLAGFFGLQDRGIPADSVRKMEQELKSLGKSVDIHFYDASHAFANPSGQAYNPQAAADAWTRTVAFFNRTLKS
ncbi:dienelactone hydrolase family protein [Longimicrobium sp.]|uniref:dienelactone hydrolase family protein n=1 Tax=Longimicrobium sp. TaxID=2029185 RepID=UPI002CD9BD91|nr:dienelactone hydrolase family protein [Longimicrobium sp.]HSU17744.1 dienelactone hydrolase family protein [Longimicrobium sp.]